MRFTLFPTALRLSLTTAVLTLALSACGGTRWGFPYRIDVQQGNWITAMQVEQLQPGMTRDQVQFLLGTPTVQDIFREDRWDYPYRLQSGQGDEEQRRFTVWFEDNLLARWAGDVQPDRQPFEPADTGVSARTDAAE